MELSDVSTDISSYSLTAGGELKCAGMRQVAAPKLLQWMGSHASGPTTGAGTQTQAHISHSISGDKHSRLGGSLLGSFV